MPINSPALELWGKIFGLPRWVNHVWIRDAAHLLDIENSRVQEARLVKQRTRNGIEFIAPIGKKYKVGIDTKSEVYGFKDDNGVHVIEWCVYDMVYGGWIPMELLDIDQTTPPSQLEKPPIG